MNAKTISSTQITKPWLTTIRAIWGVIALLSLIVIIASLQPRFYQLLIVSPAADVANGGLLPADAEALTQLGLSPRFYALYFTVLELMAALAYLFIAVLIFWRKSDDWLAVLFSFSFVALAATATPLPSGLATTQPLWEIVINGLRSIGWISLGVAFLRFPSGRFIPPWTRWLALFWLIFITTPLLTPSIKVPSSLVWQTPLEVLIFAVALLWLAAVAAIQVYRYRQVSTQLERQQSKWVVYGFAVQVSAIAVVALPFIVSPTLQDPGPTNMAVRLFAFTIILLGMIFLSVTITIAVLKYRLYDIDIVIRKTIQYGVLTALGFSAYLILAGGASLILQTQSNFIPAVVAIGLVMVLFKPLQRQLQQITDRMMPYTPPPEALVEQKRREKIKVQKQASGKTSPLHSVWLSLTRLFFGLIFLLSLIIFGLSLYSIFIAGIAPCNSQLWIDWTQCTAFREAQNTLKVGQLGYEVYFLVLRIVAALPYFILSLFIVLRKPKATRLYLFATFLVVLGTAGTVYNPLWEWATAWSKSPLIPLSTALLQFLLLNGVAVFLYIFPDGKFIPRWTRWATVIWVPLTFFVSLWPDSALSYYTWPDPFSAFITLGFGLSGGVAFILRYRYHANRIQKQQLKWILVGTLLVLINWLVDFGVWELYPALTGDLLFDNAIGFVIWELVQDTSWYIAQFFLAVCLGLAFFRYRLFEIDLIIRKTIQYGVLTAFGFGVYLILTAGASALFQTQSNLIPLLIAVGLAVVVARPALRRMNTFFDRFMPLPERPVAIKEKTMSAPQSDESKLNKPAIIWLLGGFIILLVVLNLSLFLMNWSTPVPAGWSFAGGVRSSTTAIINKLANVSFYMVGATVMSLLIIYHRPRHPIGWLLYASSCVLGFNDVLSEYVIYTNFTSPVSLASGQIASLLLNGFWVFLFTLNFWIIAIFPGERSPQGRWRWVQWSIVLWTVSMLSYSLLQTPLSSAFGLPNPFLATQNDNPLLIGFSLILLATTAIGVLGLQIQRFRQAQGEEHQQIKWLVGAVLLAAIFIISGIILRFVFNLFIGEIFLNISLIFLPIGIGIAILRYRLYDIDIFIRRTLIYGGLVGGLGLAYFSSVALVQFMSQALTGPQSNLIVVAITLTIAALFNPARRKFQTLIDRAFYREKVDARQALIAFGREVRTIIELPELLRALVTRTTDLLHIQHGAVFLVDEQGQFQLAEARNLPDQPTNLHTAWHQNLHPAAKESALLLDNEDLSRLQNGQPISRPRDKSFPLLVPLIAPASQSPTSTIQSKIGNRKSEILIAILALGPRRSDQGYSREDQTLLTGLADQAGTAIYVAQLIEDRQAEAIKREESERQLENYRNSPAGQAEILAQSLIANLPTSLTEIHSLTQKAGSDGETAAVLESLPPAFIAADAPLLARLSDGYRYLFSAQNAPETLPVGLRELSNGLADSEAEAINGASNALLLYSLSQKALSANSIPQITELLPPLQEMERQGDGEIQSKIQNPKSKIDFLAPLSQALSALAPAADALHAYERVDAAQDKLAYLASAVERLGHAERLARSELGAADRPLVLQIVESWRNVVTGAMSDLQTQARIACRLLTRHTWTGEIISLALAVQNTGRGAALNVKVSLSPAPEYTLLEESVIIEHLPAGEERQVELIVRPRLAQGVSQFRARFIILYDDPRGPDQLENFADVVHLMADEGEFQFIPNPYVVGTPLQGGSTLFFGREDIISFVQENLVAAHQNNLVLIGQRRTGKTSLLKQLQTRLDENYMPIYLDGQSLALDPGLPNFFFSLATEITFALEDANLELAHFYELSDFAESPAVTFERKFLATVRQAIGQRHLLLLLDEFEELETAVRRGNIDPSVFGFLRHLIQHTNNLSVIFCGTHRLEELAADYWSVLFNISLYRHVAYLSHEEALHLIQEPVAGYNMRYDDLALEKMWRVTAGHPYFLQLLCHSLVNQHNKSQRNYVTVADVNTALDEILASGEAHFVFMWTESSHEERLVLTALSRMMPLTGRTTPIQVLDYLAERGINLNRQTVSEAMHHLALRDTLRLSSQDSNGAGPNLAEGDSYSWQLGLLGLWVEKYKSLSRVVDEK